MLVVWEPKLLGQPEFPSKLWYLFNLLISDKTALGNRKNIWKWFFHIRKPPLAMCEERCGDKNQKEQRNTWKTVEERGPACKASCPAPLNMQRGIKVPGLVSQLGETHALKQWFSNFAVHQNHLERFLEHRSLSPPPKTFRSVSWRWAEDLPS